MTDAYTWLDGTGRDWGRASNWSGDVISTGVDNVTIPASGTETTTISANAAAKLLVFNSANATHGAALTGSTSNIAAQG